MKKVLVTGANGHIGLNLVKLLIENEYEVHAGVRDKNDANKTKSLQELGAGIVQADITKKDELVKASKEMDGVFHLAAVFAYGSKKARERIIEPTIAGTVNMVQAALENKVKKFVLTSSVVSVGGGTKDNPHDESYWNDGTKIPYYIGKIESEKKAWELVEGTDMQMYAVHPGAVIGPGFERSTPSTSVFLDTLQNNYPAIPPLTFSWVDVRDIADAHLLLYENGGETGRYIASGYTLTFEDVINKIIHLRPTTKKPRMKMPGFFLKQYAWFTTFFKKLVGKDSDYTYTMAKEQLKDKGYYSDAKLESLGWQKRDIDDSFRDTIEWIENEYRAFDR